jgi:peptidoglycan/xylan/chitin deacetylase (PgdA/CDA1 family)
MTVRISKSDYYRNEMDIQYQPPSTIQLGVGLGLVEYIPYQIRDSFVSLLSLLRSKPSGPKRRDFPIDDLADRLDPTTEEKREFWQKDFGVIMTHDVDTRKGYEYGLSKFVEMEQQEDMVSTFNIVPNSLVYDLDSDFVRTLVKDGFDIGMHGLHHDGKFAFLSEEEQRKRIFDAADRAKELQLPAVGYRAPWLHRTKRMVRYLTEAGYDWDSSFPDTDDSTVGYATTGSRTIFPFYPLYRDGKTWKQSPMLEIPVSMPQDWTLLYYYKLSEESILRVWKKKMEYIKSRGGLVGFIVHPDQEDFGHPKHHKAYKALLKIIKDADPELITCTELAKRWKRKFPPKSG